MATTVFSYGKEALSFIDQVKKIQTTEILLKEFSTYLEFHGFSAWLITGLPPAGHDIEPLVLLNGWSPEWYQLYRKEKFVDDDPCVERVFSTVKPFIWSEVEFSQKKEKRQRLIMDVATTFKMRQGFCVPLHSMEGFDAVVTVAGDNPDISKPSLASISLVSMFMHSRAAQLSGARNEVVRLSVREHEVLTWTTIGKNAEDISDTLGISRNCVEMYLKRASLKLGTRGRMRTVIEAYRRGEIELP